MEIKCKLLLNLWNLSELGTDLGAGDTAMNEANKANSG